MNFPKRIKQTLLLRNPFYPAPANQTSGIAEPLNVCLAQGLPPGAHCLQTPQTGAKFSKGKVSAAQVAGPEPLPREGSGLRGSGSCELGPED